MELQFKENIENEQWDVLVQSLEEYSFLNSSARYKYEQETKKNVFRYAIYEKTEFIGIITASVGHSKIFGNFLECKHSPLLTKNRVEYWEEIFKFLKNKAKENNCFLIRFSPLYKNNPELENFYTKYSFKEAPIHNVDALVSQYIDLTKDIEDIRRDMSKTKRNLLNRLLKNNDISIKVFDDSSQFDIFKKFHKQIVELKGYTDKPVDLLLKELELQLEEGSCFMIIGYFKGQPIGVWQCTVYGKYIHLYQAATDVNFREDNINISYILFWEAVKLGKSLGCKTFDLFGGIVPEGYEGKKHPWKGVSDFKQSMGGTTITYIHSRDYAVNKIKYMIYYYYSWFRTTLKGYTIKW